MKPLLDASIVVPAYNEAKGIEEALASIQKARSNTRARTELVVVDNGSTDRTPIIAEQCGARVIHEPTKGVSYARQAGLSCDAPIHINTDADTQVPPDWIDAHLAHYQDPDVVAVTGRYRFDSVHMLMQWDARIVRCVRSARSGLTRLLRRDTPRVSKGRQGLIGSNHSFRREDALAVGGFRPGWDKGEDTLLGYQLSDRGKIVFDPSEDIMVLTDGRRFRNPKQILKYQLQDRAPRLLLRLLGMRQEVRKRDFDDIRED